MIPECGGVHDGCGSLGLVVATYSPSMSPATQSVTVGHATLNSAAGWLSRIVGSARVAFQPAARPAGFVELRAYPRSSTATHSVGDAHATASIQCVPSMLVR